MIVFKQFIYQKKKINIINLGTNNYFEVKNSVKHICKILNLKPKVIYKKVEQEVGLETTLLFY